MDKIERIALSEMWERLDRDVRAFLDLLPKDATGPAFPEVRPEADKSRLVLKEPAPRKPHIPRPQRILNFLGKHKGMTFGSHDVRIGIGDRPKDLRSVATCLSEMARDGKILAHDIGNKAHFYSSNGSSNGKEST